MLSLNEDCLYIICEYLDVRAHIALMSTCKFLREVIENYYHSHAVEFGINSYPVEFGRNFQVASPEATEFLACIGPHLKDIHIMEFKQLKWLGQFFLKKVTFVRLTEWGYEGYEPNFTEDFRQVNFQIKTLILSADNCISFYISNMKFPNLTKLNLVYLDLSKFNAEQFPMLKKLSLYECKNVNFQNLKYLTKLKLEGMPFFNDILKCEALEEIEILFSDGNIPFEKLLELKKLRKIKLGFFINPSMPNVCYRKELKWKELDFCKKKFAILKQKPEKLQEVQKMKYQKLYNEILSNPKLLVKEMQSLLIYCTNLKIFGLDDLPLLFTQAVVEAISETFYRREEPIYLCFSSKAKESEFVEHTTCIPTFVKPLIAISSYFEQSDSESYLLCEWTKDE